MTLIKLLTIYIALQQLLAIVLAIYGYFKIKKQLWAILEIQHCHIQAGLHMNNVHHSMLTKTIEGMEQKEEDFLNGELFGPPIWGEPESEKSERVEDNDNV